MRISHLLRDVDAPARKITEAISYEPMLVTRILRVVNSPIYSLERNVTSIQTAVNTIGNKRLQEIVMMGLASATFAKEIGGSIIARKIWEHSLAVAIIARHLSEMLKMRGTEESFTCGLLHDIGKLMLLSYDFEGFSTVLDEVDEERMLAGELRLYGHDHAEIGALVAERWSLQQEVCSTIRYHHNPAAAEHMMMVTHIVEVADLIANVKGYGWRTEDESKLRESESMTKLRLSHEDLETGWTDLQKSIDDIIKTF
jgi:putative nucleotidyltransferase with HDIG domain